MPNNASIVSAPIVFRAGTLSASLKNDTAAHAEVAELVRDSACRTSSILSVSELSPSMFLFIISGHAASDSDIVQSAHTIVTNVQERFQTECTVCMSAPKVCLNQLADAISEAMQVSARKSSDLHTSVYFYTDQTAFPCMNIPDYAALVNRNADLLITTLTDIHSMSEDIKARIAELFLSFHAMNLSDQKLRQLCSDISICCSSKLLALVQDNAAVWDNIKEAFFPEQLLTSANVSDTQRIFTERFLRIHEFFCALNHTDAIVESLDYLLRTQCAKVTLQYVAEYLGISTSYLSFKFKETTHINFRDYVHQYKMEKAADYLANTQMLVQQIALQLGYNDVVNFSRVFKKYYHISPSEFRTAAMSITKEV